ncbi:unnamed protein product [Calypogeia fissa]
MPVPNFSASLQRKKKPLLGPTSGGTIRWIISGESSSGLPIPPVHEPIPPASSRREFGKCTFGQWPPIELMFATVTILAVHVENRPPITTPNPRSPRAMQISDANFGVADHVGQVTNPSSVITFVRSPGGQLTCPIITLFVPEAGWRATREDFFFRVFSPASWQSGRRHRHRLDANGSRTCPPARMAVGQGRGAIVHYYQSVSK